MSELIWLEDSVVEINEEFLSRGWSDGLPIIPPTPDRVAAMLEHGPGEAVDEIACIPPLWGSATREKIAINAVMAGCRPEYLPAIIAAVEAVADADFNLLGVQATTHPAGPLLIFNGPVRNAIGLNYRAGVFGPGTRANAAIGRALRLVLINIGGARPGELDKATMGHPGKLTYCIAEYEEATPWDPLHVHKGYAATTSTVTAVAAEGPHNVNDPNSRDGEGILQTIAGAMAQTGANNNWHDTEVVVVLCPEHAAMIADAGYGRTDIQRYLCEHAVTRMDKWSAGQQEVRFRRKWPDLYGHADASKTDIPIVRRPDAVEIVVAGGPGKHSMHVPTIGIGRSVTREIS